MPAPSATADPQPRVARWPWLIAATALVVFRAWPYAWWGTLAFDADQAVVGLMAKHVAEFRAFPVYQYALQYVLMVSAYVIAPFMWVFGPTLFALKLPLVLMNVGVGLALLIAVVRAGLHPAVALVSCLPLLMTSPVTNAVLMDALGMTIEPLAFVLALWYARRAPLAFGIIAAVGFHVREFVAYAVAALLAIDVLAGYLFSPEGRRHWALGAIAALGTSAFISGLARYASVRGPDTWISSHVDDNLATLGGAFCFAPHQAWRNVVDLGASYLGLLVGAAPVAVSRASVQTQVVQGVAGAWPVFALLLVVVVGRVAWRWRALWAHRHRELVQLAAFLTLVGVQGVGVYAISRCGPLSLLTIRYALLGAFLLPGLALLVLAIEPRRAWRQALGAAFITLAAINLVSHARIWHEQVTRPTITNRVLLAEALESRGIRYARSDYWTAYYIDFLTEERVIIAADSLSRVDVYERVLAQHPTEVVRVSTERCGDGPPIVPGYYLCDEPAP